MTIIPKYRNLQIVSLLLVVCIINISARAENVNYNRTTIHAGVSTYIFASEQSTIVQTGGIAGVHRTYSISGKFQLSIDPNIGAAFFTHVDANAIDDSQFRRSLDPNEVFNLTGLVGIIIDDVLIYFAGRAADGSDIFIIAVFNDDLVYLFAWTYPPAGSADFFIFSMDAIAQRKYAGGTGEPNEPYLIYTPEQMNTIGLNEEDWDKHFKLMANIDLSKYTGTFFNIIGYWNSRSDNKPFTGMFNGNNHVIYNFIYESNSINCMGLFGYVNGENVEIKNLGLIDPDVVARVGNYVGSLVGCVEKGSITTCYVEGGRVSGNNYVGGLIGHHGVGGLIEPHDPNTPRRRTITDSHATASVTGYLCVGGVVGSNTGMISDCYSGGSVSGYSNVGGLVGQNDYGGNITNCDSTGNVKGDMTVGGLVGENCETIMNCYTSGIVIGEWLVGGLVGNNGGNIIKCYSIVMVNGVGYVGGLVGGNGGSTTNGNITACYSTGSVNGDRSVGGLVGINSYGGDGGDITNCYNTGVVIGNEDVGGLVGRNNSLGRITSSFWDIETSGLTGSDGGVGLTTAEMQMASTFLDAGWDFVGETENGTEDIWWIDEGQGYPILSWELPQKTTPQH
jgi:hypothetical protein